MTGPILIGAGICTLAAPCDTPGHTLRRSKLLVAFRIILYPSGGQHGFNLPNFLLVLVALPKVFIGGCPY